MNTPIPTSFSPYNSHIFTTGFTRVQRCGDGYTACVMTDRKTYRLFNYDLEGLWLDINDKIKREGKNELSRHE